MTEKAAATFTLRVKMVTGIGCCLAAEVTSSKPIFTTAKYQLGCGMSSPSTIVPAYDVESCAMQTEVEHRAKRQALLLEQQKVVHLSLSCLHCNT